MTPDKLGEVTFAPIDRAFLDLSRQWLRDYEFCKLIMAQPIDLVAQEAWYRSLNTREDYLIWGLRSAGGWIGACGLKNTDAVARVAEYWGYIYPLSRRGAGLGWRMLQFVSIEARNRGIESLWLRVAASNETAIAAYQRWGFAKVLTSVEDVVQMEKDL